MADRQILSNAGALTLSRGVTASLTLVTTVYLGRVLGPEAYGMVSWGAALLLYFWLLPNLGLNVYGVREVARDPGRTALLAGRILALRLLLATVAAGGFVATVLVLPLGALFQAVVLVQLGTLFAYALSLEWAFEGHQRMGLLASRHVLVSVLGTALVFALVRSPEDVLTAALVPSVALLAGSAWLLWTHVRTFGPFRLSGSVDAWRPLVRSGLPIAASLLMVQVYTSSDQVMLGLLRGQDEVGLYAAAYRFVAAALIPLHILIQASAPSLALQRDDPARRAAGGRALLTALVGFGLPLAALAALMGGPLMGLFGERYLPAAASLSVLMGSVALGYLHTGLGRALVYWDRERPYMWALTAGAAVNVALNLLLIPRYGGPGAAAATLATEALVLLLVTRAYWRATGGLPLGVLGRGLVATGAGVVLVALGLRHLGLPWPWQLAAVVCAYPVAATAAGLLPTRSIVRALSRFRP